MNNRQLFLQYQAQTSPFPLQIEIEKADIAETARKNKMIKAEDAEQLIELLRTETNVL